MEQLFNLVPKRPGRFAAGAVLLAIVFVGLLRYLNCCPTGEWPAWLVALLVLVVTFDVFVGLGLLQWWEIHAFRSNPESRQLRLLDLMRSLSTAMKTIDLIRLEVEERAAVLADLEAKAAIQGKLLDLKREEVEAVAELVRAEVRRESRHGYVVAILINLFFFVMGIVATILVTGRG